MSIIQVEEYVIVRSYPQPADGLWSKCDYANSASLVTYQLRSNFLNTIKDGVGERLITINDAFLNTPGFKAAGWRTNPSSRQRTHSPPIPTAVTSEYFKAPQAAGLPAINFGENANEEGGMVTGGGAENTFGPGQGVKRRRRREQLEEEDSSDLSDESEEDEARAAQQIKFAKMPIRLRAGSSPARKGEVQPPGNLTSPTRQPGARRGSHSTVEAIKERARRDTATSSEMSSDNDFDNSAFKARQRQNTVGEEDEGLAPVHRQQSDLLPEGMEDDSDGSYMSSAFAGSIDSQSMMDSVGLSNVTEHHVGTMPTKLGAKPPQNTSPKKAKTAQAPAALPELPPARPLSVIRPPPPTSLLSAAIKAKRTKAALPFEKFATLSGQGDPNPLKLRIWAPFSKGKPPYFEVLIRRNINDTETGERQATVSDLIGLSLWRYTEEKREPTLVEKQLNVNRWHLRLIEDDEVDYDFPPLDRTKTVIAFATVNNSRGGRARAGAKSFDEFALVEATDKEYRENEAKTPQFTQESVAAPGGGEDDDFPAASVAKSFIGTTQVPSSNLLSRGNMNPLTTTMPKSSVSLLADMPPPTTRDPAARPGVKKMIRVYIHSSDAAPGQMQTVDVSTGTYLAEVLDMVCKKRGLDKAAHVLKLTGSGTVVMLDKTVASIGTASDLDLWRRRFGTDGPLGMGAGSPSSHSPRTPIGGSLDTGTIGKKSKKMGGFAALANQSALAMGTHPLSREQKLDEWGSANYKKWTVWRKQPMRFVGMNERVIAIDGEYLHIMPSGDGRGKDGKEEGKTTTVHFSNVVGCKVLRRHPTNFKVYIFRFTPQVCAETSLMGARLIRGLGRGLEGSRAEALRIRSEICCNRRRNRG